MTTVATTPLARIALDKKQAWKEFYANGARNSPQHILQELNTKLDSITYETLRSAIDEQAHLIEAQDGNVIIRLHLSADFNQREVISTLYKACDKRRINELEKEEGFSTVGFSLKEPSSHRGTDLLLYLFIPQQ